MDLLVIVSIILLLVMIGLGWLIIRRAGEPEPFSIRARDYSMDEAWKRVDDSAQLGENTLAAIREDLLGFERKLHSESASSALLLLRRELMDSVDRRILNQEILSLPPARRNLLRSASSEIIQTDDNARRYIQANELRLQVLRDYAGGRFGDKASQDWFMVYEKAAGMRRRTLAHFLERSATGDLQEAEDARQQAISMVDGQLRARLLQVAPGTSFRQLEETARDTSAGPAENPPDEDTKRET